MFAVFDNPRTLGEDIHNAGGKLMRLLKRRMISDFRWVEDHHVGKMPRLERTALVQVQISGRQRDNSAADRFYERDDAFAPDISSE